MINNLDDALVDYMNMFYDVRNLVVYTNSIVGFTIVVEIAEVGEIIFGSDALRDFNVEKRVFDNIVEGKLLVKRINR